MVDPVIEGALRGALALLFLSAAAHKARDLAGFRGTLAAYRLLPPAATGAAALGLLAAEVGTGVGLLVPRLAPTALDAAGGLLVLYTVAIASNLLRGRRDIDCGCSGPALRQPLSEWLIARNGLLLTAALAARLPASPRPLVWADAVTIAGAVAVLGWTYAAVNHLIANQPKLEQLGSPAWSRRS